MQGYFMHSRCKWIKILYYHVFSFHHYRNILMLPLKWNPELAKADVCTKYIYTKQLLKSLIDWSIDHMVYSFTDCLIDLIIRWIYK